MRLVVLGLVVMNLVACQAKNSKSEAQEAAAPATQLSVDMQQAGSSLGLANVDEGAIVTKALLVCQGQADVALNFTTKLEVKEIYKDVSGCKVLLREFSLNGNVYSWEGDYDSTHGIGIFDSATVSGNEHRKLARQEEWISGGNRCHTSEGCEFREVSLIFEYSELIGHTVELENNLKISKISLNAELEPAPSCEVSAEFINDPNPLLPPKLRITLADCQNTIGGSMLDLALEGYAGQSYLIDEFQDKISAYGQSFAASSGKVIELSLAEIKALSGKSDTFEALKADFIIPIRNQNGISVAYYVIDNDCE